MMINLMFIFFMHIYQGKAEVFLDNTDLHQICNVTRLLVAINVDPISIVDKTSDTLERTFGLYSLKSTDDLMTTNIERMMITALIMEFIPDLVHWKSAYRQCEPSRENPIPEAPTYKIDITNKGKAKGGITSIIDMVSAQRGIINGFGKSSIRETVSNNKFKKSDVATKFSSIDVNTMGLREVHTYASQFLNTALAYAGQMSNILSTLSGLRDSANRGDLWKEIGNSSVLTTALELDPIAGACRRMEISAPINSTDPDTWWQGIDSIRAALATANIGLIYTRQGDTCS